MVISKKQATFVSDDREEIRSAGDTPSTIIRHASYSTRAMGLLRSKSPSSLLMGSRCAANPSYMVLRGLHVLQQAIDGDGRERARVVGHCVGDDELAVVDEAAAAIDDVWDVAFSFVFIWGQQRLLQPAD